MIFAALAAILSSCHHITGSGNIVTEKRPLQNFTSIYVSAGIDVEFTQADNFLVKVEADDNVIKYIKTEKEGDNLRIGIKNNTSLTNAHLKVYVTCPVVKMLHSSSSSEIDINGRITNSNLIIFDASSSGSIKGEVDAPSVNLEASSSGDISIGGRTKNLSAKASSGAAIKAIDLLSENANVRASSSGSISAHASVSITGNASSGASITYRGNASSSVNTSSGASVTKQN